MRVQIEIECGDYEDLADAILKIEHLCPLPVSRIVVVADLPPKIEGEA